MCMSPGQREKHSGEEREREGERRRRGGAGRHGMADRGSGGLGILCRRTYTSFQAHEEDESQKEWLCVSSKQAAEEQVP